MGTVLKPLLFKTSWTMQKLLLFTLLVGLAAAQSTRNDETCQLCIDAITDLDEWLISDPTEQEIIAVVKELCEALGLLIPELGESCNNIVDTELPDIIEGLVNDNLNPYDVCLKIRACDP